MEKLNENNELIFEMDLKPLDIIERSLVKTYRKPIWARFIKAIKEFELISPGDKIAIGISGGKDSLILAKLMQELQRHSIYEFELEFIAMDPGYYPHDREKLEFITKYLEIPAHIYDSDVFEVSRTLDANNPCYMCARMRRGNLYSKAEELGCNKLALAHHYDDVIETIMLNVLQGGSYKTMMPKLKAQNFEGMELIRPLYYINENDIIRYTKNAGLKPLDCSCEISEKKSGKRSAVKRLIESLEGDFTNVRESIFKSAFNVEMGAIIEWKDKEGEKISFLDEY